MTLLEAVNLCLRSTGETGVAALNSAHPQIATILASIADTSRLLQSQGWWFNQSEDLTLSPVGGSIDVSAYTFVTPNRTLRPMHIRDGVLVDSKTGAPVDYPVTVRARWQYPNTEAGWADMPASFTEYLGASAALTYASDYDADQLQLQKLQARVQLARAYVNADNIRAAKVNLYYSGSQGIAIHRTRQGRYTVR